MTKFTKPRAAIGALLTLPLLALSTPAQAADEDACAIWICLPAAFMVEECAPAYTAMVKRLVTGKNPLPLFGSCFDDVERDAIEELGYSPISGSQTTTSTRGRFCRAGYTLDESIASGGLDFDERELVDRRGDGLDRLDDDFDDGYTCRNRRTGQSYYSTEDASHHLIRVTLDGRTYTHEIIIP